MNRDFSAKRSQMPQVQRKPYRGHHTPKAKKSQPRRKGR